MHDAITAPHRTCPTLPFAMASLAPGHEAAQTLANIVLIMHTLLAVFVTTFPAYVMAGVRRRWPLADSFGCRIFHLACIVFIATESWLGLTCPLTSLEMVLREKAALATYRQSFIAHWLQKILFYEAPANWFAAAYSFFVIVVLATWWRFPPRSPRQRDT